MAALMVGGLLLYEREGGGKSDGELAQLVFQHILAHTHTHARTYAHFNI